MDLPRDANRPPWLPATRDPVPPPVVPDPAPTPPADPPPPPGPRFGWRRITRSPRGAAGLAIAVAALLLWPFAGWSALPWLAGIGLLLLLRLLRLDGLLRGWAPHLGGIAVVGGLTLSTDPWAWALAASIGVLLAGLAQLPWWRLAVVGAALCVVTGVGFGFSTIRDAQQVAAETAQTQERSRGAQGASRQSGVLPILLSRIARNVPGPICDNLLTAEAQVGFVAAAGGLDCVSSVGSLFSKVVDPNAYERADAPAVVRDGVLVVDACAMSWGDAPAPGPQLGKLTIGPKAGGATYVITAFSVCDDGAGPGTGPGPQ